MDSLIVAIEHKQGAASAVAQTLMDDKRLALFDRDDLAENKIDARFAKIPQKFLLDAGRARYFLDNKPINDTKNGEKRGNTTCENLYRELTTKFPNEKDAQQIFINLTRIANYESLNFFEEVKALTEKGIDVSSNQGSLIYKIHFENNEVKVTVECILNTILGGKKCSKTVTIPLSALKDYDASDPAKAKIEDTLKDLTITAHYESFN